MRISYATGLVLALFAAVARAADGDFDLTYGLFNSGKNVFGIDHGASNGDTLSDMLLAPDGSAYLVGSSDYGNGHTVVSVLHVDAQGVLDSSFNLGQGYTLLGATNGTSTAQRAAFDANGNLLIAVTQLAVGTDTNLSLVGVTPTGSVLHFGANSSVFIDFDVDGGNAADKAAAVLALPNGDYVLAGTASTISGNEIAVAKINPDGTPDPIFGGGTGQVHYAFPNAVDIKITSLAYHDGKLLVAGSSKSSDGAPSQMFIARLLAITGAKDGGYGANGACILSFNEGVGNNDNAGIESLIVQNDGDIYAAGYAQIDANRYRGAVIKLQECAADSSFGNVGRAFLGSGYTLSFSKLAVEGNGDVVAIGTRRAALNSDTLVDVARFKSDGTLDTTFGTLGESIFGFGLAGGHDNGVAVAVDSRRIVAAGGANQGATNTDYVIAGLQNDLIFANNFED